VEKARAILAKYEAMHRRDVAPSEVAPRDLGLAQ
jgi:hypothetical protein